MTCPRCGQLDVSEASCPGCGIVLAKFRAGSPPRPRAALSRPAAAPAARHGVAPWIVVLALALGAAFWLGRSARPAATPGGGSGPNAPLREAPERSTAATPAAELPFVLPTPEPQVLELPGEPRPGMAAEDLVVLRELHAKASHPASALSDADLQTAQRLVARYPDEASLRQTRAVVELRVAEQQRRGRQFDRARALAQAAATEPAVTPAATAFLANVALETGDWAQAEQLSRAWISLEPRSLDAQRSLALALFRQDRNREAREALEALLAQTEDAQARALLERIVKTAGDEKGMKEQHLAHFNVRYDGDEHTAVGQEILRALERHYATLTSTLDHQVKSAVPVILFSRESYYAANGMPAWAGGHYDQIDGRIRIPIGGLTNSLTDDLDGTLIHELTHAFIHDRSAGLAPRPIHEGLAQYMEGKRIDELLERQQVGLLAQGRAQGVGGFYLEALAFVEDLMRLRGQGGVNDLLRRMGETGSVDDAFRDVYGKDFAGTQAAWRERFARRDGD